MSAWKIYPDTSYYFCTTSIVQWIPIFTNQRSFQILIDSLKYCQNNKGLKVHAYVIMLNHMHLIVSANNTDKIPDIFRDFKRYTSTKLSSLLLTYNSNTPIEIFEREANNSKKKQNYKIWQPGYHPIGLETEHFFKQKLHYLHKNPVVKGYVAKPDHWVYSSARNYAGYKDVPLLIDKL